VVLCALAGDALSDVTGQYLQLAIGFGPKQQAGANPSALFCLVLMKGNSNPRAGIEPYCTGCLQPACYIS
jgi:hypothetical protein